MEDSEDGGKCESICVRTSDIVLEECGVSIDASHGLPFGKFSRLNAPFRDFLVLKPSRDWPFVGSVSSSSHSVPGSAGGPVSWNFAVLNRLEGVSSIPLLPVVRDSTGTPFGASPWHSPPPSPPEESWGVWSSWLSNPYWRECCSWGCLLSEDVWGTSVGRDCIKLWKLKWECQGDCAKRGTVNAIWFHSNWVIWGQSVYFIKSIKTHHS